MSSNDRELVLFLFVALTLFTWVCLQFAACCMRREQPRGQQWRARDYRSSPFDNAGVGPIGYRSVGYHSVL